MIIYILPAILLLGIVTSYTDIRFGKVKNKHLLLGLLYFILYATIMMFTAKFNDDFIMVGINFILAFFVGYLLWYVSIWTSGDAKLFIVYSLLLPLSTYQFGSVIFFPAMTILINTFVPFFIFYFIKLLIFTPVKLKLTALKVSFNPKNLLNLALMLFSLMWVVKLISTVIGSYNPLISLFLSNFFVMIFMLFLLMELLQRILLMNLMRLSIIVAVMRLFFDRSIYSIDFLIHFSLILLIFIFARLFILRLMHVTYVKHVDIHMLRPGMFPAEGVFKSNSVYKKEPMLFYSLWSYMAKEKKDYVFEICPEGLSNKDCQVLRKLKRDKKIKFEHLKIYQTLPFAIFLFVGVILTLIAQGNVFAFLMRLFL